MGKIINIRGCNASGKTTTVRTFIEKYKDVEVKEIKTENFKTKVTFINKGEIIVIGKYDDSKTCGCDRDLANRDNLIEILIYILKKIKPKTVIYEGVIYGKTFKLATDVYKLGKLFGYKYKGIYLHRELDGCIKLLEERNEGGNYNVVNVLKVHQSCLSAYNSLKKAGYNIEKINVESYKKDEMYKIIEKEI